MSRDHDLKLPSQDFAGREFVRVLFPQVSGARGSWTAGADGAPSGAPFARGDHGEDPAIEAGEPVVWGEENRPCAAAAVHAAGQSGNRAPEAARGGADGSAAEGAPEPHAAALLRASDAQPDVAERSVHLPARREIRLRGRLHGRLLALHRGARPLPLADGGGGDRDLPGGGRGILPSQGDAHGPGPAVYELAGQEPLRGRIAERPGGALRVAAAAPDDAGEGGAVLGLDVAGVFGAGPVRLVRVGAGAAAPVGEILQPPPAPPGDRRAVPGGPLL